MTKTQKKRRCKENGQRREKEDGENMLSVRLKQIRKKRKMTLEELAAAVGTSKQTIHRYENGTITNVPPMKVKALADALGVEPSELMGWERSGEYKNIAPITMKTLPILGSIACGKPIYAEEVREEFCTVSGKMNADFCLIAKGDSMSGARIYDGDVVFIRSQSSVDNGEIAAVIIGDEATLKRVYYYPDESKLILTPENPRYAPLVYMNDELEQIRILGKAVAFQSAIV